MSAATAAIVLDGAIATIALPTIARALAIDEARTVQVITVYQLVLAVSLIPMSALGERLGLRRLFRAGLVILALGSVMCLLVSSLWQLLLLRGMQAVGAGMALSVGSAQIRSVYPQRILGRGLALNSLTVSVVTAAAPVAGAAILLEADWPLVFAAAAPVACVGLAASSALPEGSSVTHGFDWASAVAYAVMMGLLFFALDGTAFAAAPGWRIGALAGCAGCAAYLLGRARRSARPLLPIDLLRRPVIALSVCGALCAFASSMAVLVLLPFRLGALHAMAIEETGLALAVWPLTTMLVAPAISMASDRVPPWLLGSLGMLAALAALGALMAAPADTGVAGIGWRLALAGAGYAAYTASNARLIIASTAAERAAPVGGLIATTRILGQSAGAIAAGAALAADWTASWRGLMIPLIFAVAGAGLSLTRRRAH